MAKKIRRCDVEEMYNAIRHRYERLEESFGDDPTPEQKDMLQFLHGQLVAYENILGIGSHKCS